MSKAGVEFIAGQRGMGKTSYVKLEILPLESRYLIYDHMAEFTNIKGIQYFNDLEQVIACIQRNKSGLLRIAYVPLESNEDDFALVCRIPFLAEANGLTLIVDEIDNFAPPVGCPDEFKRLIHFGRHFKSRFIGCSRRPADVSRLFTSQAYRIISFRQTEPRDITYLTSLVGRDAERISDLAELCYLRFENGVVNEGKLVIPGYIPNEPRQDREVDKPGGYSNSYFEREEDSG